MSRPIPTLVLRPPDSLQGQQGVPQVLYDYMTELVAEVHRLRNSVTVLEQQLGSFAGSSTISLAAITGGGTDGSLTINRAGIVTSFSDPT